MLCEAAQPTNLRRVPFSHAVVSIGRAFTAASQSYCIIFFLSFIFVPAAHEPHPPPALFADDSEGWVQCSPGYTLRFARGCALGHVTVSPTALPGHACACAGCAYVAVAAGGVALHRWQHLWPAEAARCRCSKTCICAVGHYLAVPRRVLAATRPAATAAVALPRCVAMRTSPAACCSTPCAC